MSVGTRIGLRWGCACRQCEGEEKAGPAARTRAGHSKKWGKNGGGYLPYGHAPVLPAALDPQPVLRARPPATKRREDDWNQSQKLVSVKGKNARGVRTSAGAGALGGRAAACGHASTAAATRLARGGPVCQREQRSRCRRPRISRRFNCAVLSNSAGPLVPSGRYRSHTAYHWNLACIRTSSYSSAACSQLRSCCMPRCCSALQQQSEGTQRWRGLSTGRGGALVWLRPVQVSQAPPSDPELSPQLLHGTSNEDCSTAATALHQHILRLLATCQPNHSPHLNESLCSRKV